MSVVDFNMQTEGKLNSMVLTPGFTNKPSSPSLHPHSSLSRTLLQADVATWIVVYYSSTAQQRQTSQCSSPVFHTICNKCADVFQINATLVFFLFFFSNWCICQLIYSLVYSSHCVSIQYLFAQFLFMYNLYFVIFPSLFFFFLPFSHATALRSELLSP